MKLNSKTRYGIRTMLEIGSCHSVQGVFQKEIAERQGISVKYLDQIIHALKTAMLIRTVKGKKSGYVLCYDPAEITLYQIYLAFEPSLCVVDCLSKGYLCERSASCSAQGIYGELNQLIVNFMKSITLRDLINKQDQLDHIFNVPANSEVNA